jgi:hypothetical protein
MVRGLILMLALAGPAMAEQPTHELGVQCGNEASVAVRQELEPMPYDTRKPETMKAYKEASDHAFSETYLKTFERCMLQGGFKFRFDVPYCADNANPPHKPNKPMGLTSLLENVCYERIR